LDKRDSTGAVTATKEKALEKTIYEVNIYIYIFIYKKDIEWDFDDAYVVLIVSGGYEII
jgi:hypothetical protein